jgi:hypothetical protein
MPCPEPHELVRERGDERNEHDPRQEEQGQRNACPRDEAEEEDADHHDDEEERRPAAGVGRPEGIDLLGGERPVGLVGADRLVLGAVVREDAADVVHEADGGDVGDEDCQPDQPLDRIGDEVAFGRLLGKRRQKERQEEEQADGEAEAEDHRDRDRPLPELDVLTLRGDGGGAHEHARADHERLVEQEHAAQERDLDEAPICREGGGQRLGHRHDLAVRRSDAHGDRRTAAHHDALDQGLAAIEEVRHAEAPPAGRIGHRADHPRPGRDEQLRDEEEEMRRGERRPPRQATAHPGSRQRSERSSRFWKRST